MDYQPQLKNHCPSVRLHNNGNNAISTCKRISDKWLSIITITLDQSSNLKHDHKPQQDSNRLTHLQALIKKSKNEELQDQNATHTHCFPAPPFSCSV